MPRILYHWRRSDDVHRDNIRRKPKALEAGRRAIEEHLQRARPAPVMSRLIGARMPIG